MARYFGKAKRDVTSDPYTTVSQSSGSFDTFDPDDDFWNDYNLLNDQYKKQLDPYLHYSYKLGWADKLGNWLGFNSSEDRYRMSMQQKAREVLAGLQNDVFQNDYDSASAQASRQRDAGLNPDLQGEADGEPAAGLDQPLSPIDPSIYAPPVDLIPDIAGVLGTAATGLQSVGTFTKLLADISKTRHESVNVELSSWDQALKTALDYVSARDPELERQVLEEDPDIDLKSEDFFNQKMTPSKVAAVDKRFSHLSPKAMEMMKKAVAIQSKNPVAYDNYYKGYSSAAESRTNYLAFKDVHGSLALTDDVIQKTNRIMLNQRKFAIRSQYKWNAIIQAYNVAKATNDWNFEEFKAQYHLPEQLVETDFARFVASQAEAEANASIERMRLNFVNYMDKLASEQQDPAAQYILQAVLTKMGYAPLMTSSLQGGAFGVGASGSWQNYIVPGTAQGMFPSLNASTLDDTLSDFDTSNRPYWSTLK